MGITTARILVVLVAAAIAAACGGGGSSETLPPALGMCGSPLSAGGYDPLTNQSFQVAGEALLEVIDLADAGDVDSAEASFFLSVHGLTHVVDGPLREVDEGLAIRLCNEVLLMEQELVGGRVPSVVSQQAEAIRGLLSETADAMDVEAP